MTQITLINDEWHSTHVYTSHNLNIPIQATLCGAKSTGLNRVIRVGTSVPTCQKCLEHLKNSTFVNFIGEVENDL